MAAMQFLFYFVIIVPSAIIHEYAHGAMADALGDKTARYAGRLTLNPMAHIDMWGTIVMPVVLLALSGGNFMFAYAKPVPYNPYNLKNQKWGPALVGLAGPMSNFMLACAFAVVVRALPTGATLAYFLAMIVYANLVLMIFNLVPIPPLDGSKVLLALLPHRTAYKVETFFARYGIIILLLFVFVLFDLISPIIQLLFNLLIG